MPEFRAVVNVMLRRAILDPQGRAVEATLHRLGHANVGDLRVGKRIELSLTGERAEVEAQLAGVVERVLSNPVMEDATFELHEVAPAASA
ncbi:MAG: phosphoribosylformylglycinamidine synthase subunit PurS [Trueperaceae bacterium]